MATTKKPAAKAKPAASGGMSVEDIMAADKAARRHAAEKVDDLA